MDEYDALVRRADEDRWLASRFAPRAVRAKLVAIYALNIEIARTAEMVREPGLGAARLAWWREGFDEIEEGGAGRAPVLATYRRLASALPLHEWRCIIEARAADFEPRPFMTWAESDAYLDATAGGVMRLALAACGASEATSVRAAALAWGYAGLIRAAPYWAARGRAILPGEEAAARARAAVCYAEARAQALPAAAFPALGYVALTPTYLRGAPLLLQRQLRLVSASLRGRL